MPPLKKILYVEDEKNIQTVARIALENVGGFTVEICSSGREAVEKLNVYAPDLILLDVMMPGMDGPTTLKEIRKKPASAGVPVVFMTAKIQPDEIQEYKNIGAADVIPKPFDPMKLASQVQKIYDSLHSS